MLWEQFVVVSDDGGFLCDIRKGNTKNGAHLCEKDTELIQNDTEFVDWYLFLSLINIIDFFEVFFNKGEIEFWIFFHLMKIS